MPNHDAAQPTSSSSRRLEARLAWWCGLVLLACVGMTAPASAALAPDASGSTIQQADPRPRQSGKVERLARERAAALAVLDRRADRHAVAERQEAARLASYGLTGEVTAGTRILPLAGYRISGSFGSRGPLWASYHTGTDFSAPTGTPLVAIGDATVTEVGDAGAYGLRTILTLGDGTQLWYCHQSAAFVQPGQQVTVGQAVGAVGSTGNSTGPHLHLEVRPGGGGPVDPVSWLQGHGLL